MKSWGTVIYNLMSVIMLVLYLMNFLLRVNVVTPHPNDFGTQSPRMDIVLIGLFGAQNALGARRQRTQSIPAENQGTARNVRPVVTLAFVFTLGFITLITVSRIVMTAVYPEGFVSALKPYQSLQPGIALTAMNPNRCGPRYFSHDTREEKCDVELIGDKLSQVTLALQGNTVEKVTFVSSGAQVGDLIQLWGRPDSITKKQGIFTLHWDIGILTIAKGRHSFNYQLPVVTAILR